MWFVQTVFDGTVHHCAWGKWYKSKSQKLSSLGLQLRHSPTFPKGSTVGTVRKPAQKALSRHCNGPFDRGPNHWYSLFCRVSDSPLLSQTRWDPDDSLIVFVGRLNRGNICRGQCLSRLGPFQSICFQIHHVWFGPCGVCLIKEEPY